jgi:hypothetical protein
MELLTPDGWSPATSIQAMVMSIRTSRAARAELARAHRPRTRVLADGSLSLAVLQMEGHEARLQTRDRKEGAREHDYSAKEAKRDFAHIVSVHKQGGWTSHKMFRDS